MRPQTGEGNSQKWGVKIIPFRRREFSQMLAYTAVAPVFASAEVHPLPVAAAGNQPGMQLESFNYSGVRLLDGMLLRQFQLTRQTYYNLSNDSLLLGFRQRAGLPAPGKVLDGWYGSDYFHPFGQFLAGMARMSKATNDQPMRV
jgi:hypothetical protein